MDEMLLQRLTCGPEVCWGLIKNRKWQIRRIHIATRIYTTGKWTWRLPYLMQCTLGSLRGFFFAISCTTCASIVTWLKFEELFETEERSALRIQGTGNMSWNRLANCFSSAKQSGNLSEDIVVFLCSAVQHLCHCAIVSPTPRHKTRPVQSASCAIVRYFTIRVRNQCLPNMTL